MSKYTKKVKLYKTVKLVIEFLSDKTEGYNVGVYELDNLIMLVGDINCGIGIYNKDSKSFQYFIAKNIDAILKSDDRKVYEDVDIETLIERLCEQDDNV